MPNQCRRCDRATDLYLCKFCVSDLREHLHRLPLWLHRLGETARGDVRMSDGGRRHYRRGVDLIRYTGDNGDDHLAADLAAGKLELGKVLSSQRINTKAADELQRIHNTLSWWISTLCEKRGIDTPELSRTPGMARWLEKHASAVAHQEDGLRCCDDIEDAIAAIERIVNRPVPPLCIGPCPTDPAPEEVLTDRRKRDESDHSTRCANRLKAHRKDAEVTCPQCHQTYAVDDVVNRNMDEQCDRLFTVRELTDWLLPLIGEPLPVKTLERWIRVGVVPAQGFAANGAQMVRLGDVRRAREDWKPKYARTG